MTEPTPTPTPTPAPGPTPAAKTRKHGVVNIRQQNSLALAETVSTAAAKDEYSTVLDTEHEITPAFIAQIAADCVTARGGLGQVVENAVTKNVATGGKTGTKQTLKRAIRKIQAAAKQKYAASQPVMLKDYYVGQKIDANQDTLEQVGTAIRDKISPPEAAAKADKAAAPAADVLPGITAGKIAVLSDAVDAFTSAWSAQTSAQSDKSKGHIAVAALVKSIDTRRRIVQYAVDGEWPFDDAANAPILHSLPSARMRRLEIPHPLPCLFPSNGRLAKRPNTLPRSRKPSKPGNPRRSGRNKNHGSLLAASGNGGRFYIIHIRRRRHEHERAIFSRRHDWSARRERCDERRKFFADRRFLEFDFRGANNRLTDFEHHSFRQQHHNIVAVGFDRIRLATKFRFEDRELDDERLQHFG